MTRDPLWIVGGHVAVPDRPGFGIEIDMDRVRAANELYKQIGTSARDDGPKNRAQSGDVITASAWASITACSSAGKSGSSRPAASRT